MITPEDLIEKVKKYNPDAEIDLIMKAYSYSADAHKGQVRESGEPFLLHPLEVSLILTDLKLDVLSIAAGLLHDIVEDTDITIEKIGEIFGKEIAELVGGVTKIGKIEFKTREEKQAENMRKMILSMAEDIRVILIKLADRLHNMRTLEYLPEHKQKRVSQETLEIYASLANRLGIGWMKSELEDLSFRYLKPEIYFNLEKKIAKKRVEREKYIQEVINIVQKEIKKYGFKTDVIGRPKHLYSIYQKMERLSIPFEEVYDRTAIRIITDIKMNCYGILGLIHSIWSPVPGRFKDYIGVPKSNMYQSLHTTVIGPGGEHLEVQIRTREMHNIAEEGIASHWKYKEKGEIDKKDDKIFGWLRQLVEWQRDMIDNRQFMDSVKTGLIPDVVYIFTPKGDVKEMLKGSTPIDFAFSVHSDVGKHCAGAKVNGKIVPLKYQLRTGDSVEIITSATQLPSKDWLKMIKTPKAKARIKHWIKEEERKRSIDIGRKIFEKELRHNNLSPSEVFKSDNLLSILKEFSFDNLEEFLVAIGFGKISPNQILHKLLPEQGLKEGLKDKIVKKMGMFDKNVRVKGINDILINFSKCCSPVPGDKIIGFITRGRGLSIHTIECPNIDELDYDKDRLVEVDWDSKVNTIYPIKINVLSIDKPGLLAKISASITSANANISHAEITTTDDKKALLNFVVDITDVKHIEKIIKNIEKVDGVIHAKRLRRA